MRTFLAAVVLVVILRPCVYGADIYIAQSASGSNTGADCADAHSAAWFNANSTGGNVYHLCGTFTGTAGSTMLSPNGGSAGNVLTVLFESGAVLTAPYWGNASAGAINISGKSYITIDGGTNGIIQNTANGSTLANRADSAGVYIANSSNIEIKNLTIQNIYIHDGSQGSTDELGQYNYDVYVSTNANSNILIHNNTLNNAHTGVYVVVNGTTDAVQIYNNYISDHVWGVAMGSNGGGPTITNVLIHDNEITGWINWQCPSDSTYCTDKTAENHTDGIILFQDIGGPVFSPVIYNNYIHGNMGQGSTTAMIFCTYGSGTPPGNSTACIIFDNLLVSSGTSGHAPWLIATGTNTGAAQIYNNTLVGYDTYGGTGLEINGTGTIIKNNIVSTTRLAIGSYGAAATVISTSNNNLFYSIDGGSGSQFGFNDGGTWYTWAQWQALGFDANSTESNPNLDSNYKLQASSPAIGLGANLTSLCSGNLVALCTDKASNPRPASGGWDAGAYQFVNGPNPPSNLQAQPQ